MVIGVGCRAGPAASLGRVVRELVLRASCPVLVVPQAASAPTDTWTRRPVLCTFDGSDGARRALSVAAGVAERLGAVAFVAHVGRGSVGEVEARARTERPALIVTASCGAESWHAGLPGSGPVRLATPGSTPVLFVPPAYRPTAAPRLGVAIPADPGWTRRNARTQVRSARPHEPTRSWCTGAGRDGEPISARGAGQSSHQARRAAHAPRSSSGEGSPGPR
jgi:nucleotide-binding universal stress UspA family protein